MKGGKREGAGRKPLAEERRTSRSIKFSSAEWEQVQERAKQEGISASEYVRRATLEGK